MSFTQELPVTPSKGSKSFVIHGLAGVLTWHSKTFAPGPRRMRSMTTRWSMTSVGFGRTAGPALVGALLLAVSSLYFRGDWRNIDVDFYHLYALGFWGHLGHPLLPSEYPPLSVLPFGITLIGPAAWFPATFAIGIALVGLLGYIALRRLASPTQAGAYVAYALAAGLGTVFFRYDLVPSLLAGGAVWCVTRKRFGIAYALVAVGALMKLYPLALLPIAFIAHRKAIDERTHLWLRPLVGATACVSTIAIAFAFASFADPRHGLSSVSYDFKRPIEIESVQASVLWLLSFAGLSTHTDGSFGSLNLISSGGSVVGGLSDAALAAGLIFVCWCQWRERISSANAAVAAVLVLLSTSKVLSAQYFVWLAPLLAIGVGFQLRWLFLFLATSLIFPALWGVGIVRASVPSFSTLILTAIAVRNVLLIVLTAAFLRSARSEQPTRAFGQGDGDGQPGSLLARRC